MIQVFLHLTLTTELCAFVRHLTEGAFAVVERQGECGSEQNLLNARQPANEHRRVYYGLSVGYNNIIIYFVNI